MRHMTSFSLGTMSAARPKSRSYQEVEVDRSVTGTLAKRTSIMTRELFPTSTGPAWRRRRHVWRGGGSVDASREQTELVPFRICENHPRRLSLTDVCLDGPERLEACQLIGLVAPNGGNVYVDPVLRCFPFRHMEEHQRQIP